MTNSDDTTDQDYDKICLTFYNEYITKPYELKKLTYAFLHDGTYPSQDTSESVSALLTTNPHKLTHLYKVLTALTFSPYVAIKIIKRQLDKTNTSLIVLNKKGERVDMNELIEYDDFPQLTSVRFDSEIFIVNLK